MFQPLARFSGVGLGHAHDAGAIKVDTVTAHRRDCSWNNDAEAGCGGARHGLSGPCTAECANLYAPAVACRRLFNCSWTFLWTRPPLRRTWRNRFEFFQITDRFGASPIKEIHHLCVAGICRAPAKHDADNARTITFRRGHKVESGGADVARLNAVRALVSVE